jgi:FtsP/CotA-like multicopper oxidase with cupredoxin domain
VELVAAETGLPLMPGKTTSVYAYNGSVPGPTLEFMEGDRVTIRFRNDLPTATTVHWHGIHLPFDADGSPFHLVSAGRERVRVHGTARHRGHLLVPPAPAPPHGGAGGPRAVRRHHRARRRRPAARLADRTAADPLGQPVPADGSLDLPDPHSPQGRIDFENGREGDVLFVNGEVMPTLTIRSGEVQRWRVVNASAGRFYRLALPGHTLLHVGSDGGLFERPVEVDEILLATAERVELLVRGTGEPGSTAVSAVAALRPLHPADATADWDRPRDLLTLAYSDEPPLASSGCPRCCARCPARHARGDGHPADGADAGLHQRPLMDMERVDVARLGATEIWELENLVGMDHPFHLHGFQFQVLDRDGVPEPFRSWKDTVNVPRSTQTVRFIVRYDNYPGMWMFHCHILDHEDHGMMGVLEVR